MAKNTTGVAEFEAYLNEQPEPFRETLEAIRQIVKSEVPDVTEHISYGVPTFRYMDHGLVAMGVKKDACSFYTMNPGLVKLMKDALVDVSYSGSTLHFVPGEPPPEVLIRQIVRTRMSENEARAAKKRKM
ncbi:MAG: DUF1801 domain-containing protein [Anaerolineae bacterium]|nr:DUF1801 domain-containing protein [Anaerolineae bacterium]